MALANGFKAKAAALGLGLASVVAPAVIAEEEPQQYASAESTVPAPVSAWKPFSSTPSTVTPFSNVSAQAVPLSAAASSSSIPFTDNAAKEATGEARRAPGMAVGV